jgi:hypothetical protein
MYNSGSIAPTADPAAAFITQVEDTFTDHTGNWEFVEEVILATIPYRVWRNRGTVVTNPNLWGSDYYVVVVKGSTAEVRFKVFESYTPSGGTPANAKGIRPIRAASTASIPNANGSYGDEVAGYTLSDDTNLPYVGTSSLQTTGFDYYLWASRNAFYFGSRQGVADVCATGGVFETLLTASPAETFPLYMGGGGGNLVSASFGSSRQFGVQSSNSNWRINIPVSTLSPLIGGVGSALIDLLHGGVLAGRPLIQSTSGGSTLFGQYRGEMYDALLLSANGTTRIGDTVTINGDVYVRMSNGASPAFTHWVERDAV